MSQTLRIFIREAIKDDSARKMVLETTLGDRGEQLDVQDYKKGNPPGYGGSSNTAYQESDPSFLDRIVTFFSDGFTDAQKRGEGEGSIIGSKVSISKMGKPQFIVLCKISYKGKDYLVAKKYSDPDASEFDPVPNYGKYLDPNVLLHGDIIQLPDPQKVYKIKEEEVSVLPAGENPGSVASMGSPTIGQRRIPFFGMGGKQTVSLITHATDPKTMAAWKRDHEKRKVVKNFDTASRAKIWVEEKIGAINNVPIEKIDELLLKKWKIVPVSYADFDGASSDSNRPSFTSTLTPEELYNDRVLGLFEFDPNSKVFPPPFSYTVKGIISRMEQECNFDAKEYINTYWRYISDDLTERESLNLSLCSNEIATSVVLDFVTLALSFIEMPLAAAAVRASITAQTLALLQMLIYQWDKGDKNSAIVTAARIVLQLLSYVDMRTAYTIITSMLQIVADVTGSVSIDVNYVKQFFNDKGMRDDQLITEMPEFVSIDDYSSQQRKLPEPL